MDSSLPRGDLAEVLEAYVSYAQCELLSFELGWARKNGALLRALITLLVDEGILSDNEVQTCLDARIRSREEN